MLSTLPHTLEAEARAWSMAVFGCIWLACDRGGHCSKLAVQALQVYNRGLLWCQRKSMRYSMRFVHDR